MKKNFLPLQFDPPVKDPYKDPMSFIFNNPLLHLTKEQVDKYNGQLQDFFSRYKLYWKSEYLRAEWLYHAAEIKLRLINTGTAPADDVDIVLHFPDGFDVLEKQDIPKISSEPSPPYRPAAGKRNEVFNYL